MSSKLITSARDLMFHNMIRPKFTLTIKASPLLSELLTSPDDRKSIIEQTYEFLQNLTKHIAELFNIFFTNDPTKQTYLPLLNYFIHHSLLLDPTG